MNEQAGFSRSEHDEKYGKYGVDWHYDDNGAVVRSPYTGERSNQDLRATERVSIEQTHPDTILNQLVEASEQKKTENGPAVITFDIDGTEFLFDSRNSDNAVTYVGGENNDQAIRVAQGLSEKYTESRE